MQVNLFRKKSNVFPQIVYTHFRNFDVDAMDKIVKETTVHDLEAYTEITTKKTVKVETLLELDSKSKHKRRSEFLLEHVMGQRANDRDLRQSMNDMAWSLNDAMADIRNAQQSEQQDQSKSENDDQNKDDNDQNKDDNDQNNNDQNDNDQSNENEDDESDKEEEKEKQVEITFEEIISQLSLILKGGD